jgi:N-glycosylase/DNA lyase
MRYNEAKAELMKIVGVGDKVADCVLLFGFHRLEAFPRDVWIKRVLAEYYPGEQGSPYGLPACIAGYEGIAQQFLFHYIRNVGAGASRPRERENKGD